MVRTTIVYMGSTNNQKIVCRERVPIGGQLAFLEARKIRKIMFEFLTFQNKPTSNGDIFCATENCWMDLCAVIRKMPQKGRRLAPLSRRRRFG